jgi:beta-aspartyl-peptidase (threonine type)
MHVVHDAFRAARAAAITTAFAMAACQPAGQPGTAPDAAATSAVAPAARVVWGLAMHGGAGTIQRESMTPELEAEYRAKMEEALRAGHTVLSGGGAALDAVEAAVNVLEDSPLFNAGKGAVFTADGTNSLDASIMDGSTLRAGAVAGVTDVKNPISLARLVMEQSPHVMLSGAGAQTFARLQNIPSTPAEYFRTDRRWQQLQDAKAAERASGSGGMAWMQPQRDAQQPRARSAITNDVTPFGTVGAIALDQNGNLAAATSTGGMTNKKWGRIGDSPVIAAGTYANADCGVSGTGWGEYFIRNAVAYDICARMKYAGVSLARAAQDVIDALEAQEPETGGVIAMDGQGNIAAPFNTSGMYRGWIDENGNVTVRIYADEN